MLRVLDKTLGSRTSGTEELVTLLGGGEGDDDNEQVTEIEGSAQREATNDTASS